MVIAFCNFVFASNSCLDACKAWRNRRASRSLSCNLSLSLSRERERERESLVVHDSPIITVELRSRPRQYLSESIALDRWMILSPPSRPLFL